MIVLRRSIRRHLEQQGFGPTDARLGAAQLWLRFTPAASTALLAAATIFQSPGLFWGFGALALVGSMGVHAFDLIFDHLVRPLVGAARLPPNPPPRRFSMLLGGLMGLLAGTLVAGPSVAVGTGLGALLCLAALVSLSTHFCPGAWIFRRLGFAAGAGASTSCTGGCSCSG